MLNELYKIDFKEIIFYKEHVIESYSQILKLYLVIFSEYIGNHVIYKH